MNETLILLSKVLPQLAVIAVVSGWLGWWLRGKVTKPVTTPLKANGTAEKAGPDRAKNLEAALEKSKAAHRTVKAELEALQAASVPKTSVDQIAAELESTRQAAAAEGKRIATLETDLKKAQDTIKNLNNRANDVDRAQKDRRFALENELSKAREQLAVLQERPDDTASLQAEIERLRESVATTTRFAGELRKREAAATEELEKVRLQLADVNAGPRLESQPKKIGPVGDSDRIAAAKAEVLRLVEQNRQRAAAVAVAPPVAEAVSEAPVSEAPVSEAPVSEAPVSEEPISEAPVSEEPVSEEPVSEAPVSETPPEPKPEKKPPVHAELFTLD